MPVDQKALDVNALRAVLLEREIDEYRYHSANRKRKQEHPKAVGQDCEHGGQNKETRDPEGECPAVCSGHNRIKDKTDTVDAIFRAVQQNPM